MTTGSAVRAYLGGPRIVRRDDEDAPRRRPRECTACGYRLDPVLVALGRVTHYDGESFDIRRAAIRAVPAPTREEAR